jgi:FAM193 family C-terminal
VFAPNQQVNLNELDLLERDIESFKRFNYYFDPPKNKPKININVKDIVVTGAKKARSHNQNSSESPSFGDRISDGMSSSFTSSNCDELFTEGDLNGGGAGGTTTAGVIGSNDFGIGTAE